MLWVVLLALIGVVASAAQSYDYGIDIDQLVRRQDPSAKIIVGRLPLASNGSTPVRLELRDMRKDGYMWDLYVLALSMFQSVGQDQSLSWYQVAGKTAHSCKSLPLTFAGIHGVPFQPWNGVQPAPGASLSGYCTHSSVLFPTWHRPYLALYEVCALTCDLSKADNCSNKCLNWQMPLPVCLSARRSEPYTSKLPHDSVFRTGIGAYLLLLERHTFQTAFGAQ